MVGKRRGRRHNVTVRAARARDNEASLLHDVRGCFLMNNE